MKTFSMFEMRKMALLVYILLIAMHFGRPASARLRQAAVAFDKTYSVDSKQDLSRPLASYLGASEAEIRTALLTEPQRPSSVVMAGIISKSVNRPLVEILGKTGSFNGLTAIATSKIDIESAIKSFHDITATLDPATLNGASNSPHATIAAFGN